MPMGDTARTDGYNDEDLMPYGVGSPAEGARAPSPLSKLPGAIFHYLGDLAKRNIENSQTYMATGENNPAPAVEAALNVMSGGIAGTGERAGVDIAAGYDPKLWHGVSSIKLPKPIDEMSSIVRPVNAAPETVISPAKLKDSLLMPLIGDRSAAAAQLERVNGFQFENPVPLQGGHGYMANNPDMAWAAGKSIAPGIAKVAKAGAETGRPVHGVYTAMGERTPDFTHMMSDTLVEMAKHTKITPQGEALFNETMRKISPAFPGIHSPEVAQYLRDAPGAVRNVFAKAMDTAPMQKHGFPSVAEARVAVTDPRLLHEPTGAAGLSIARMDPEGKLGPSGHSTYSTGIAGNYVGGLPASVPKEIMFPDIVGPLSKHADAVAQARVDAGKTPFRPTEDYLMGRMPKGLPKFQEANQQWVDAVSKHLEDRGFKLGSGATDQKTAAAIQGIRAYHSSPHDFDKFDLSKIGTGEGAQVYGHGIYAAENPAVSGQGGQYWQQFTGRFGDAERAAAHLLEKNNFDRDKALLQARKNARLGVRKGEDDPFQGFYTPVDHNEVRSLLESGKPVGPRTYELNINADPAHMLDWDKPLAGQSPYVREALTPERLGLKPAGPLGDRGWLGYVDEKGRLIGKAQTGKHPDNIFSDQESVQSLYRGAGSWKPDEGAARMRDAGIPGIKYLDQGSRPPPPRFADLFPDPPAVKTSNYVVFDPSIIDITKKYAVPATLGGATTMGALARQDEYQP